MASCWQWQARKSSGTKLQPSQAPEYSSEIPFMLFIYTFLAFLQSFIVKLLSSKLTDHRTFQHIKQYVQR